jgi:hypothetical protein
MEIYTYTSSSSIYMSILPFPVPQGGREWVDGIKSETRRIEVMGLGEIGHVVSWWILPPHALSQLHFPIPGFTG